MLPLSRDMTTERAFHKYWHYSPANVDDRNDGFVWLHGPPNRRRVSSAPDDTPNESNRSAPIASPPSAKHLIRTDQIRDRDANRRPPTTSRVASHFEERVRPITSFFYRHYFRVKTEGLDVIPTSGPCLVMSNHAGGPLPFDGMMLREALRREHPRGRSLRWLNEDFVDDLPFVGAAASRLGAIPSRLANAERLLEDHQLVAVFPEGTAGISKAFHQRHRLLPFGHSQHIEMALRTRTPVVPCAIVGAEDLASLVYRFRHLLGGLGLPQVPVRPAPSRLGAVGLLPAPTSWYLRFGQPIAVDQFSPRDADDETLVMQLSRRVHHDIQGMLDDLVATRSPSRSV